jgi:endogenous inhibitor of DNA gyrase (YacG/DUF329 family)
MRYECPICGKGVIGPKVAEAGGGDGLFFPFCSDRCRLIDLGAWLDAEYRIPLSEGGEDEDYGGE